MTPDVRLVQDLLLHAAARLPTKEALVSASVRYAFRTLESTAHTLANAFARRGVQRGDRVVIFCENGVEAVVAFWAALEAGAVAVPVHPATKPERLAYILRDSRATAMVTSADLTSVAVEARARGSALICTVVAGEGDRADVPGSIAWDTVMREGSDAPPLRRGIDLDLAAILYTSTSQGEPNGVMHTHRSMLAEIASRQAFLPNGQDDVILDALPMSASHGLFPVLVAASVGARLVVEKSTAEPSDILERIAEEKVTGLPAVPSLIAASNDAAVHERFDLGSVRYVTSTGDTLSASDIRGLRGAFPNARIFSLYGLTECGTCTYLPPEDLASKPTSVGIAAPQTEVWVIDAHGHRTEPNVVGEIVVRSASLMSGYWNKPVATAARLAAGPVPGELVLCTGDLGKMDDDGYLSFVGRTDDIVKSGTDTLANSKTMEVSR